MSQTGKVLLADLKLCFIPLSRLILSPAYISIENLVAGNSVILTLKFQELAVQMCGIRFEVPASPPSPVKISSYTTSIVKELKFSIFM